MNCFFIQAIPIVGAADDESSFWVQILVFVLLAVCWWVYSLVRSKRDEVEKQQRLAEEAGSVYVKSGRWFQLPRKHITMFKGVVQKYAGKARDMRVPIRRRPQEPMLDFDSAVTAGKEKSGKDLRSGMELLELDFLLSVVENTKGDSQNDVTVRKLNFEELLRRKELNQVNSKALKIYAVNQGNLYGKDIQCEAMRELAERTPRAGTRG